MYEYSRMHYYTACDDAGDVAAGSSGTRTAYVFPLRGVDCGHGDGRYSYRRSFRSAGPTETVWVCVGGDGILGESVVDGWMGAYGFRVESSAAVLTLNMSIPQF